MKDPEFRAIYYQRALHKKINKKVKEIEDALKKKNKVLDQDDKRRIRVNYVMQISYLNYYHMMSYKDAERIVETFDGFLFTGGQDVSPSLYGTEDATGTIVSSPERDKEETLLLQKALEADKPVLGICRGLQFINVFLGGTLWQDLPSQHPSGIVHRQGKPYGVPTHQVSISGELQSLLGKDILDVNTLHHQAVKDLGNGLTPMAVAPDGLIEAFQMLDKRFVWAVQWHPEYLFKTDKDSLAIFSCFVEHCK